PEGFRRRHHRRAGELSSHRRWRHHGRPVRKLRGVLEQRLQGGAGVQPADPDPDLAVADDGDGSRGGDRGGRPRGWRLMRWRTHLPVAIVIAFIAVAPFVFGAFTITLM